MSCYLLKDRALSILLCLKIRINKQLCHIKFDNYWTTKVKHTKMYLDHQTTIIKKTNVSLSPKNSSFVKLL